MKNKQVTRNIKFIFIALLLLVITIIGGRGIIPAFADTSGYSTALTDLQKDSSFDISDYPSIPTDYSLQVIQIAESTDGSLIVYTYQPCQLTKYLTATKINMSLTDRMGGEIGSYDELADIDKPQIYDLTLLSCVGVFCKYLVQDYKISSSIVRYYNIASIYREFIDEDDDTTGTTNLLGEKAFAVSQLWTAVTSNGYVDYSKTVTEVVVIRPDQKYIGHLRYTNGFSLGFWSSTDNYCDSWYVAFDCDYKIDDLYEADVVYDARTYSKKYTWWGNSSSTSYGEWQIKNLVTLRQNRIVENELIGWYGSKHEWAEIQSVDDFISVEDLKDDSIERLKDKQWVLRFALTDYTESGGIPHNSVSWNEYGTEIANVSILRLCFEMNGKKYNLGVVDSMHTPDTDAPPDNNPDIPDLSNGFFAWLERLTGVPAWVWKIIASIIPILIVLPILGAVFPAFGQILLWIVKGAGIGLLWVLKGLWWVVCLPIRGIALLIHKIRGD